MRLSDLVPFIPRDHNSEAIRQLLPLVRARLPYRSPEKLKLMEQAVRRALQDPACPDLGLSPAQLQQLDQMLALVGHRSDELVEALEEFRQRYRRACRIKLDLLELAGGRDAYFQDCDFVCFRDAVAVIALAWLVKYGQA